VLKKMQSPPRDLALSGEKIRRTDNIRAHTGSPVSQLCRRILNDLSMLEYHLHNGHNAQHSFKDVSVFDPLRRCRRIFAQVSSRLTDAHKANANQAPAHSSTSTVGIAPAAHWGSENAMFDDLYDHNVHLIQQVCKLEAQLLEVTTKRILNGPQALNKLESQLHSPTPFGNRSGSTDLFVGSSASNSRASNRSSPLNSKKNSLIRMARSTDPLPPRQRLERDGTPTKPTLFRSYVAAVRLNNSSSSVDDHPSRREYVPSYSSDFSTTSAIEPSRGISKHGSLQVVMASDTHYGALNFDDGEDDDDADGLDEWDE
jgi:hypothetical protein